MTGWNLPVEEIKMTKRFYNIALGIFIFLIFFLASCSHQQTSTKYASDFLLLSSEQTVGQTFYSRFRGLNSVTLQIGEINPTAKGDITLSVYKTTDKSSLVSHTIYPLAELPENGSYSFSFPAVVHSNQQNLYFELSTDSNIEIQVSTVPGYAYINGAAYSNLNPTQKQLDFEINYDYFQVFISILIWLFKFAETIFWGFLLFFLPGYGILTILDIYPITDIKALLRKIIISIALSLSIYPLVMLWTGAFGLHLGRLNAYLPVLLGVSFILYRQFQRKIPFFQHLKQSSEFIIRDTKNYSSRILIFAVLFLLLLIKFWAIRDLPAPLWGDSLHHTTIAQLMLDNGGLFSSWEPYAPYKSLTIHYGFSSMVAVYSWFSGIDILSSTLLVGQWINFFALITPIILLLSISKEPEWSILGILIFVGLLSYLPAIYTNWGRYAQLAGQTILPALIYILISLFDIARHSTKEIKFRYRQIFVAALLLGGMTLTHYRMPIFLATIIFLLFLFYHFKDKSSFREIFKSVYTLALVILLSVILIIPWLPRIIGSSLSEAALTSSTPTDPLTWLLPHLNQWKDLSKLIPIFVIGIIIVSLLFGILKKKWILLIYIFWPLLLMLYLIGALIQLPIANLLEGFAIMIMLYIPISLVIGWFIGQIKVWIDKTHNNFYAPLSIILTIILCIIGINIQSSTLTPQTTAIVTYPDLKAMEWIRNNTPEDALFLVEGYIVHYGYSAVGTDAGWWIPLLTERGNTMPPQYAMVNEESNPPDHREMIVELVDYLNRKDAGAPASVEYFCDLGITHAYVGQGRGRTGAGVDQLFSPIEFTRNPQSFQMVYHQDRVYIYQLLPEVCSQ